MNNIEKIELKNQLLALLVPYLLKGLLPQMALEWLESKGGEIFKEDSVCLSYRKDLIDAGVAEEDANWYLECTVKHAALQAVAHT